MNISATTSPVIFPEMSAYEHSCSACGNGADAVDASGKTGPPEDDQLTEEEQKQVQELKQRDTEVRAHEQAHIAAGGGYVRGGASYEYQTGPDGRRYAVGGEVSIDSSKVTDDPQATIRKMQIVRKAALAPANPSGQDRSVAATASRTEAAARQELLQKKAEEREKTESDDGGMKGYPDSAGGKTSGYSRNGISISRPRDLIPLLDIMV